MTNQKLFSTVLIVFILFTVMSCKKEPTASISADKSLVEINETVTFTNSSVNGVSYLWNFGDQQTSTEEHPRHSWSTAGDYVVTMTAYSKREKKSSSHSVNVRVTDYAYKFSGLYSGISNYQSSFCGSGSSSNNIQITAPLAGNNLSLLNLDNKFPSISGNVTGPGNLLYILPQTGIYANDGSQWDMDTIKLILSGSSLIVVYSMSDLAYTGTCGNYLSTIIMEK